jgi:pimeloyl-ACP methyl ester carboxylesterase
MIPCKRWSWLAVAATVVVATSAADEKKSEPSKSLDGLWSGTLKAGVIDLRLVFKIDKKSDGWTGSMDSIDEGLKGIPIEPIDVKDDAVKLELKTVKAVFEGKLKADGSEMVGAWKQRGANLSLTLKRTDKAPEIVRPQNPKKPYPYDEHEVKYHSLQEGIKLAGTLTVPRGQGPFPAVIMLSGSGAQDRDEMIFNHKPFLVIADHLTRHGIAVLRVDDRGVGGSTGDVSKATLDDNAQDVLAGIALLNSRKEIDANKIGLIGHSEGGVLAPYVAARSKDVAFIVMLAGTGVTGEEILYLQGQAILKAMGMPEAALKRQRETQELLFSAIKQESDNDKAKKLINERLAELKSKLSPIEQALFEAQKKGIEAQVAALTTPWFRNFLTHDPRPELRKVRVPVLALIGEKDVQVPPKVNLEEIGTALAEGGNKDHTLKEMAGLNHLFQTAKTGSLQEYGQIEETFAPAALTLMTEWILKRTR